MARPKQSGDDFPQSRLLGDGSPAVSSLSVQFAVHMLSVRSREDVREGINFGIEV